MSISRSVETSCRISAIGKSGARSSGPTGCFVPGCSTGGGGEGRSAIRLYQRFGSRDSSRTYLTESVMEASFGDEAILYLHKQVEDAVEPRMIERVRRVLAHDRLRAVRDRNPGCRHHRNVVCAVADRHRVRARDAEPRDLGAQPVRLCGAVDDSTDYAPRQPAPVDLEHIRKRLVDAEPLAQPRGEEAESAGNEQRADACISAAPD